MAWWAQMESVLKQWAQTAQMQLVLMPLLLKKWGSDTVKTDAVSAEGLGSDGSGAERIGADGLGSSRVGVEGGSRRRGQNPAGRFLISTQHAMMQVCEREPCFDLCVEEVIGSTTGMIV
jgi:hypothetical protein